jgi:sugar phosphate isomerase/epimerase
LVTKLPTREVAKVYRVGYRTASFAQWPLGEACAALGRLGYDSLELCLEPAELLPTTLTPARAREVVDQVHRGGLRLHSVSFHGDELPWADRARQQLAAVQAAPWLGVSTVVINTPPTSAGVDWKGLCAHLRAVAQAAEEAGVTVAVEPEPGTLAEDVAHTLRLLDEISSGRLAVNLDLGHAFLTEADLPAAIMALAERIVHTHCEDMPADAHRHLVPGEGCLPWKEALSALWRVGFRGVLTLDLFGPYEDPLGVAARALRAMRDLLRQAMPYVHSSS